MTIYGISVINMDLFDKNPAILLHLIFYSIENEMFIIVILFICVLNRIMADRRRTYIYPEERLRFTVGTNFVIMFT